MKAAPIGAAALAATSASGWRQTSVPSAAMLISAQPNMREPGRRHVDEHDLHGRALLVVVGRAERLLQPDGEGEHRRADEPRQQPLGERQEARRVGEIDQGHRSLLSDATMRTQCGECADEASSRHSMPCRSAAAAAKGPTTRLTSVSAHRIVNGVPNGSGPDDGGVGGGDAEDQHRDRQRQHQHRPAAARRAAAPP